jgi:hypothetical protein
MKLLFYRSNFECRHPRLSQGPKEKKSASFLKKRSKKLLLLGGLCRRAPQPAVSKSFLPRAGSLLFLKKEALTTLT